MENTGPIACTLTAADLLDRRQAWLKVGNYARSAREVPGGLAFSFRDAPGVEDSLRELVKLEAECCAWMAFALDPGSDTLTLTITGDGEDGQRGVRLAFAPLVGMAAGVRR